jgi:hypothetical protein
MTGSGPVWFDDDGTAGIGLVEELLVLVQQERRISGA